MPRGVRFTILSTHIGDKALFLASMTLSCFTPGFRWVIFFNNSENKHLSPNLDTWDWKNGLFCLSNLSRRNSDFVELLLTFQLPRLCCFKCFCERQIFLCQQLLLNVVTVKSNRKEDMLTIFKLPSKTRPCFEVKGETRDVVECFPLHCFRALACYCVLYNRMKHSQGFFIF